MEHATYLGYSENAPGARSVNHQTWDEANSILELGGTHKFPNKGNNLLD
jgi:hypothetical protein